MNEFGTYKGVEYEVSDSRAVLKTVYFNNTNTNETFTRMITDVTEERIQNYIDNKILFTHMEETLVKYFDNKDTIVFRMSNIFENFKMVTYSREISYRIKKSSTKYTDVGNYRMSECSLEKSKCKKYKAEKVRCENDN